MDSTNSFSKLLNIPKEALYLLIIVVVVLIAYFAKNKSSSQNKRCTKEEFAGYYGVSKKTLSKWVQYFCTDLSIENWKKLRKLDAETQLILIGSLGLPRDTPPFNKGLMKEECDTHYRTLREVSIILFERQNISLDAYKKLDVFPPRISEMILKQMG